VTEEDRVRVVYSIPTRIGRMVAEDDAPWFSRRRKPHASRLIARARLAVKKP
jgi:hypothetical protein